MHNLNICVSNIVLDFETAVFQAVERVLGNQINKHGCFYHLCQNTWRHTQDLGLIQTYIGDEQFRLFVALIDALAFLSYNDVMNGMAFICRNMHPLGLDLLNYFETYVNSPWRNAQNAGINMWRYTPMFPPQLWNVHDATLNNNTCTNKCIRIME